MNSMRLDQYISTTYLFTRNKSQQLIDAGLVSVNGKVITKASFDVHGDEIYELKEDKSIIWVSRSAGKLDGFIEQIQREMQDSGSSPEGQPFRIFSGASCLDIGSSTGGFTQVLLEHGANHVDAVDVGSNQLHDKIKNNPRVTSYEQTDIRKFPSSCHPGDVVARDLVSEKRGYDIITCDVSFISLREIVPELSRFAHEDTEIFLLFKPQFEVGRENLRKTGVPKDKKIVEQKLKEFEVFLFEQGFQLMKKSPSSVIGEAGNEEWMMRVKKKDKTFFPPRISNH